MLLALLLFLQNEPTAALEGVVLNQATGARLANAQVTAVSDGGGSGGGAVTDAAGRFAMRKLAPGRYRLLVSHPAFPPVDDAVFGVEVSISAAETRRDVTLRLAPPGAIEGKVLDQDGDPLPGCGVSALRYTHLAEADGTTALRLLPQGQSSTNDLGEYRIFNLPVGGYYLLAHCDARHLSPSADENEILLDQFYPSADSPAGATRLAIAGGTEHSAIDFRMRSGKAITVRGRVQVEGKPKSAGFGGTLIRTGTAMATGHQGFSVSPDGSFQVPGVVPGTYRAVIQGFETGGERYFGETPLTVSQRPMRPLTINVRAQPDITGAISFDGTSAQRSGLRVWFQPPNEGGCAGGGMASPGEDGTFVLKSITPGDCFVMISGGAFYLKSLSLSGTPVTGRRIHIPAGSGGHLQLVISTKVGRIEGLITGLASTTAAFVAATGPERHLVRSEPGGSFQIPNLAPGEYRVVASEWAPVPQHQIPLIEGRGKSVKIEEGGSATISLEALSQKEVAAILGKQE